MYNLHCNCGSQRGHRVIAISEKLKNDYENQECDYHSSPHDTSKYLYKLNSHVISECDIFRRLMPLFLLEDTQPNHCNLLNGSPQSSNHTKWRALSRLNTRRQLLARIICRIYDLGNLNLNAMNIEIEKKRKFISEYRQL